VDDDSNLGLPTTNNPSPPPVGRWPCWGRLSVRGRGLASTSTDELQGGSRDARSGATPMSQSSCSIREGPGARFAAAGLGAPPEQRHARWIREPRTGLNGGI